MSEVDDDIIRTNVILKKWLALEAEHEQLDLAAAVEETAIVERQQRLQAIHKRDGAIEQEQALLLSELAPALAYIGRPATWRDLANRQDYVLQLTPVGTVTVKPTVSHGSLAGLLGPRPAEQKAVITAIFNHPDDEDCDETGEFKPVGLPAALAVVNQAAS